MLFGLEAVLQGPLVVDGHDLVSGTVKMSIADRSLDLALWILYYYFGVEGIRIDCQIDKQAIRVSQPP